MDTLRFARDNYRRYRKTYRLCTVSIFISVFLILFFCSVFRGSEYIIRNEIERNHELRELKIFSQSSDPENSSGLPAFTVADARQLTASNRVRGITVQDRADVPFVRCTIAGLEIDPPMYLDGFLPELDTFPEALVTAEKKADPAFRPILAGRDLAPGDTDVCLLNEASAYMAGIRDLSSLVGQEVILTADSGESIALTVAGVYAQELAGNYHVDPDTAAFLTDDGLFSVFPETILITADTVSRINGCDGFTEITVSAESPQAAMELGDMLKSRYSSRIRCDSDSISKVLEYLRLFSLIFLVIGILTLVLSVLNLAAGTVVTAEKRKKWFALQSVLGFTRSSVTGSFVLENTFAVIRGTVSGLVCVFLFDLAAWRVLCSVYGEYFSGDFTVFMPPPFTVLILLTVITAFVLFISWLVSSRIRHLDPVAELA